MYVTCVQVPMKAREGVGSSGAGVTGIVSGCKPLNMSAGN